METGGNCVLSFESARESSGFRFCSRWWSTLLGKHFAPGWDGHCLLQSCFAEMMVAFVSGCFSVSQEQIVICRW